jgi:acetyltransferase-like isoleucine patch superfamily enzyme
LPERWTDPFDPELLAGRERARDLCQALNATRESQQEEQRRIPRELFGTGGDSVWMQPLFFCEYGANIELGERVFFNFNCIVLDVCRVHIGDYTLFGPVVQIHTPMHPFNAELRRREEADRHRLRRLGRGRRDILPGVRSDRVPSSEPAAWSRATFQTECSRRGIRARMIREIQE